MADIRKVYDVKWKLNDKGEYYFSFKIDAINLSRSREYTGSIWWSKVSLECLDGPVTGKSSHIFNCVCEPGQTKNIIPGTTREAWLFDVGWGVEDKKRFIVPPIPEIFQVSVIDAWWERSGLHWINWFEIKVSGKFSEVRTYSLYCHLTETDYCVFTVSKPGTYSFPCVDVQFPVGSTQTWELKLVTPTERTLLASDDVTIPGFPPLAPIEISILGGIPTVELIAPIALPVSLSGGIPAVELFPAIPLLVSLTGGTPTVELLGVVAPPSSLADAIVLQNALALADAPYLELEKFKIVGWTKPPFTCMICGTKLNSEDDYISHMISHLMAYEEAQ